MHGVREFNILIIGKSGSGKSATTKLLTGIPSVKVGNSLKEVTTEVNFYRGASLDVNGEEIRFQIMDIPGLDKINNRAYIREHILDKLEEHSISLNAILYISSLTERDTVDQGKLFSFLQQLPWNKQLKKNALIPVLTKYDNLIIDDQEDQVESIKKQFKEMFIKSEFGCSWQKRIYWINQTKNLQFKIKCYEDIHVKYQKQIQRLVEMIKRNKYLLTAQAIKETIQSENKYILNKLFHSFENNQISFKKEKQCHQISLKISIQPKNIEQSFMAVSASSIGLFISKVCQRQLSSKFSLMLISVPIMVALLKLTTESAILEDHKIMQTSSGVMITKIYEQICSHLNNQLEKEWKYLNDQLQINTQERLLKCTFKCDRRYKFFDFTKIALTGSDIVFKKEEHDKKYVFIGQIPKFKEEIIWTPQISMHYDLKRMDEENILKQIQRLRKQFWEKN